MTTIEELEDRLNKHAAAILRLRKDRDALLERVAALEGRGPVSDQPDTTPSQGTYVPKPTCLACGRPKGDRIELTCRPCGSERNKILRTKGKRPSYSECGNCGTAKAPGMQLLCSPCSTAFREWKDSLVSGNA